MIYARRKLTAFLLIFFFILLGSFSFPDDQGWINNSLTIKIDPKFSLKMTNETRCYDLTYKDPFLKNFQAGLVYSLPKNFYVAFLYKRESTDKQVYQLKENRLTFEGGWKFDLDKKTSFDARFRTEIRSFEKSLSENHLRFRFRLRLRTKVDIGQLHLKPFIATEPFADTIVDDIFRNRFYLGTVFVLTKNVDLVVNYIRQDTKGKDTNHILNTGFELKF